MADELDYVMKDGDKWIVTLSSDCGYGHAAVDKRVWSQKQIDNWLENHPYDMRCFE